MLALPMATSVDADLTVAGRMTPRLLSSGDARLTHTGSYSGWLWKSKNATALTKWLASSVRRYFTIDYETRILSYSASASCGAALAAYVPFFDILDVTWPSDLDDCSRIWTKVDDVDDRLSDFIIQTLKSPFAETPRGDRDWGETPRGKTPRGPREPEHDEDSQNRSRRSGRRGSGFKRTMSTVFSQGTPRRDEKAFVLHVKGARIELAASTLEEAAVWMEGLSAAARMGASLRGSQTPGDEDHLSGCSHEVSVSTGSTPSVGPSSPGGSFLASPSASNASDRGCDGASLSSWSDSEMRSPQPLFDASGSVTGGSSGTCGFSGCMKSKASSCGNMEPHWRLRPLKLHLLTPSQEEGYCRNAAEPREFPSANEADAEARPLTVGASSSPSQAVKSIGEHSPSTPPEKAAEAWATCAPCSEGLPSPRLRAEDFGFDDNSSSASEEDEGDAEAEEAAALLMTLTPRVMPATPRTSSSSRAATSGGYSVPLQDATLTSARGEAGGWASARRRPSGFEGTHLTTVSEDLTASAVELAEISLDHVLVDQVVAVDLCGDLESGSCATRRRSSTHSSLSEAAAAAAAAVAAAAAEAARAEAGAEDH
eukprot:TRINITY_DN34386_c0_g1_i1.p1 TRINITY_DN34386_c0_g1~~TRINITY_DN34386_c0_g1_i1.p1  ORF type:complete len:598 (+),score=112.84 TRINITY_DN34386_c0_g1_i1:167-1960(+)